MIEIGRELRCAVRSLRSRPVLTVAALLLLALGLGINTAVLSVVHGVLLQPLPVTDEDRLVRMWKRDVARGFDHFPILYPEFEAWREGARSFESLAAVSNEGTWTRTLERDGRPSPVAVAVVSDAYFEVLGVRPVLGRGFRPQDATPGGEGAVVLSHRTWRERFGADAAVVGRAVELHGRSMRVVGVAPPGFDLPAGAEIWMCLPEEGLAAELEVVGRLRPGVTLARAREELQGVVRSWEAHEGSEPRQVVAVPLREALVGDVRRPLAVVLGAAALLLLVTCANLAHLFLLGTLARRRELGVRAALGAGAGRIALGVATEIALLVAAGGALALVVGELGIRATRLLPPHLLPRLEHVRLDLPVFGLATGTALLVATLCGLLPALRAAATDPATALRGALGAGAPARSGRPRWRSAVSLLVVAQVALSLTLAVGAGLLLRSFWVQKGLDRGFPPARMLSVSLHPPPSESFGNELLTELLQRLEALPGVTAASAQLNRPLAAHDGFDALVQLEGQSPEEAGENPWVNLEAVTPGYLPTFGPTLRRGRFFSDRDTRDSRPVAVVNRTLAKRFWPGRDAVGRRLRLAGPEWPWIEVVGVVEDLRYRHLTDLRPDLLLPASQSPWRPPHLALRMSGGAAEAAPGFAPEPRPLAEDLIPAVREEIRRVAPRTAVEISPMARMFDRGLAAPRFQALLNGAFALLALGLMAAGLYGLLATEVVRRRRELGIRLALGARRGQVVGRLLGRGLAPVGLGLAVGLLSTVALSRILQGLLYGVTATDPATYGALTAALLAVALLATWWPARRAALVDPVETLKEE